MHAPDPLEHRAWLAEIVNATAATMPETSAQARIAARAAIAHRLAWPGAGREAVHHGALRRWAVGGGGDLADAVTGIVAGITIGARCAAARRALGLTLAEVGAGLGVSPGRVWQIEADWHGELRDLQVVQRLGEVLGVDWRIIAAGGLTGL